MPESQSSRSPAPPGVDSKLCCRVSEGLKVEFLRIVFDLRHGDGPRPDGVGPTVGRSPSVSVQTVLHELIARFVAADDATRRRMLGWPERPKAGVKARNQVRSDA